VIVPARSSGGGGRGGARGGGRGGDRGGGRVEDVVTVAVIVTKKPIKGILTLMINNAFQDLKTYSTT
jgi:hypothetical protein